MNNKKTKLFQYNRILSIFLLFGIIFLGIGYASVNDVSLRVAGIAEAIAQDGVFITDVTYVASTNADVGNSNINYFFGTMLDSKIALTNSADSTISYKVMLHNNSNKEYVFIKALTDDSNGALYDNSNITYNIKGLEEYVTTIGPNEDIEFIITFKYLDPTNITNTTLSSKLNFRFQEKPKLILDKDYQEVIDIYPDYTPGEYTFKVSNYDDTTINNVPMTYNIESTIDQPLSLKIYDGNNNEVTNGITLEGNGITKIDQTYTLKVFWDNTNPESVLAYNNLSYAGKEFLGNLVIKATPTDDKYLDYEITKTLNVKAKSATFDFGITGNEATVNMDYNLGKQTLTLRNYNEENTDKVNKFDSTFKVSLKNETQFNVATANGENTLPGGSKKDHNVTLDYTATTETRLLTDETVTLVIEVTAPYPYKTELQVDIHKTIMLSDLINDGLKGAYLSQNYKVKDKDGVPITVPKGFRATNVTEYTKDGVVMEDANGNQFVWVPVDGTKIAYTKWTGFYNSALPVTPADDVQPKDENGIEINENSQIAEHKGFWIGRYEIGMATNLGSPSSTSNNKTTGITPVIKRGAQPWNFINYPNAKIVAENFIKNDAVQSGLPTRKQWDAMMKWAENEGYYIYQKNEDFGTTIDTLYTITGRYSIYDSSMPTTGPQKWITGTYTKTKAEGIYIGTGLNEKSNFKNIYDLVGNVWEWTTEIDTNEDNADPPTHLYRGSYASAQGYFSSYYTGGEGLSIYSLGFRVVLYIK